MSWRLVAAGAAVLSIIAMVICYLRGDTNGLVLDGFCTVINFMAASR